jgi:hypothetical protein
MSPVPAELLPPFTNQRVCAACRAAWEIRVSYCRSDDDTIGAHYHRRCTRCGHTWTERAGLPTDDRGALRGPWPESPRGPVTPTFP